jgi:hypothetical protein
MLRNVGLLCIDPMEYLLFMISGGHVFDWYSYMFTSLLK